MTDRAEIWGKYGDGASGHHPLVCHLVDVLLVQYDGPAHVGMDWG